MSKYLMTAVMNEIVEVTFQRIVTAKNPEEAVEIAKEAGFTEWVEIDTEYCGDAGFYVVDEGFAGPTKLTNAEAKIIEEQHKQNQSKDIKNSFFIPINSEKGDKDE